MVYDLLEMKMLKIICIIFIISFNLYPQTNLSDIIKNYNTERDELTSKVNILTAWQETYKYMRESKFRFYKKYGRDITLEFRYRSPYKIYVNRETPIRFAFNDGSAAELYSIQRVIYNPYLTGNAEYYDIEVKYKFNNESEFDNFVNNPITNIRFSFFNYMDEANFDNITMSTSITTNWMNKFSIFKEGIEKIEELKNRKN